MANNLQFATVFQSWLDEELTHRSYTGWMTPNESMVDYAGGKDIKIAQMDVSGLGDYKPVTDGSAYPNGAVSLVWKPYEFTMDRAVRFLLGRTDPSDSHFMATTENIMRLFAQKQLAVEQDIYRFNRLYAALLAKTKWASHIKTLTADLTSGNIISTVSDLSTLVKEDSNEEQNFVAFMTMKHEPIFREALKNSHNAVEFGKTVSINGASYRCAVVNELPVIFVPSSRMQTAIKINDGRTAGQTEGGIVKDASSQQIELLLTSSDAVIAAGKVDSVKVIAADDQQTSDETTINYHYVYDCWGIDNQLATVGAIVRGSGA